ncbi:aspartate/glutamate racemase family protein [Chloroflexota bacterium]
MKILILPPYRRTKEIPKEGRLSELTLLEKMRKRGQLEGIETDIDEGYFIDDLPLEPMTERRDEEFLAKITLANVIKVKEYCETGKYDAIVCVGTMGMGFLAARMIAKIPVVTAVHSGFYVASFIGERFTLIEATDAQALIARHWAQVYGLNNKLASVRYVAHSSTHISKAGRSEERSKVVDGIVTCCIKAIEDDRADTLILGCTPLQLFEDEVRERLDESGYDEIPIVCELAAALEMAKVMVNMQLTQAPRAYPSDALKAKPHFR